MSLDAVHVDGNGVNCGRPKCWIGLDGTRAGWSMAILHSDGTLDIRLLRQMEDMHIVQRGHDVQALAIDIPIALSSRAQRGGRGCDREARRILAACKRVAAKRPAPQTAKLVGPSSIFTPPSRPALDCFIRGGSHADVSRANVASATTPNRQQESKRRKGTRVEQPSSETPVESVGLGLSIQTYHILPKMVEVLDFIAGRGERQEGFYFEPGRKNAQRKTQDDQIGLFECHPELAFLALSARQGASCSKGLEDVQALVSKKLLRGREQRLALLSGTDDIRLESLANPSDSVALASLASQTSWSVTVVEKEGDDKEKQGAGTSVVRIPADDVIDSIVCALAAKRFTQEEAGIISIEEKSGMDKREFDESGIPMTIFV